MITVICTFVIALIFQRTSHEFVFVVGHEVTRWAISAGRIIHWASISFILSGSESSVSLLCQDPTKTGTAWGGLQSRNYGKKAAGMSKPETRKTTTASSTWPFWSVYHSGIALYSSAHALYPWKAGSMQPAALDCQPHDGDHSSDQSLLARRAEDMWPCKPCSSPGNTIFLFFFLI